MAPKQPLPEWWKKLSAKDRATLQRIMGKTWKPSNTAKGDVARAFAKTRSRIREIERRALKKLRGGDGNGRK
jgi:DNA-directed RNA polymerase sigma subunit (sigma70/sigma32)